MWKGLPGGGHSKPHANFCNTPCVRDPSAPFNRSIRLEALVHSVPWFDPQDIQVMVQIVIGRCSTGIRLPVGVSYINTYGKS